MDPLKDAPTAIEEWRRLRGDLAECLSVLNEDEYLLLTHKRRNIYVQFAGQGQFGMRVEATSNAYIQPEAARLSKRDYLVMGELGWHMPDEELAHRPGGLGSNPDTSPNFFIDVAAPVDFATLASLAVETLIGVYRVQHPGMLVYKAFDSERAKIRFPTLRLKWDES